MLENKRLQDSSWRQKACGREVGLSAGRATANGLWPPMRLAWPPASLPVLAHGFGASSTGGQSSSHGHLQTSSSGSGWGQGWRGTPRVMDHRWVCPREPRQSGHISDGLRTKSEDSYFFFAVPCYFAFLESPNISLTSYMASDHPEWWERKWKEQGELDSTSGSASTDLGWVNLTLWHQCPYLSKGEDGL